MAKPQTPAPRRPDSPRSRPGLKFDPVPMRPRHDGWTVDRQIEFIEALAECGCVVDACRRVGMSPESAYALRRRVGARGFRVAWENALALAVRRISDGAFSRALHGVAIPHYYKGELVGEHRRFDERLTMFLLRHRDPLRYADPRDRARFAIDPESGPEDAADYLESSIEDIIEDACAEEALLPDADRPDADGPDADGPDADAPEADGRGESPPDVP